MGDEFRALQRRLKITTIYVTHDQEEAMALSDRVVVMQKGRILQIGAPETVYRRPASRDVAAFFGTPNLIEAKVTACRPADGEYVLSIESSSGRGDCRADQAFGVGEPVLVMVRPEDVTLAANGTAARPASSPGPARSSTACSAARGASLVVETANLRFNVECPATRAAAVGRGRHPAGRRRQCLGVEALDGPAARTGRQEARRLRLTGRTSSRPSRAACA